MELSDLISPEGAFALTVGLAFTGAYVYSQRERIADVVNGVLESIGYSAAPMFHSRGIRMTGPGFYEKGTVSSGRDLDGTETEPLGESYER